MASVRLASPPLPRCLVLLAMVAAGSAAPGCIAFTVTGVAPAHGAGNVAPNAPIVLTFSGPVLADSIVLDRYPPVLSIQPSTGRDGQPIAFQWALSADKRTLTLTHQVPFEDGRTYLLTVQTDPAALPRLCEDSYQRPLLTSGPLPNPSAFTIGDMTPPTIVSHSPEDGGVLMPGHSISVAFSKPVVAQTLTVTSTPSLALSVALSTDGRVATVTPAAFPPVGAAPLSISLRVAALDVYGRALAASPTAPTSARNPWSVTLVPWGADVWPPQLQWHAPADGATAIDCSAPITLVFNEPVAVPEAATWFRVDPDPGGTWSVQQSSDGTTLTITHTSPLRQGVQHTFTLLAGGVVDASGNGLAADQAFRFAVSAGSPPFVLAMTPSEGSANVPYNATLSIVFSKPIRSQSLAVALSRPGGTALAGVSAALDGQGTTAIVVHPPLLEDGGTYELKVLSACDLDGQPLVAGMVPNNAVCFSTIDHQPPSLTGVTPANGAVVQPSTTVLQLRFSEPVATAGPGRPVVRLSYLSGEAGPALDPASAQPLGGGAWAATQGFSPDGRSLNLVFAAGADGNRLRPGDTVLAQLLAVWDAAGNQMAPGSGALWSFSVADTRPPMLIGVSPAPGSLASLDQPVVLRFSKPINQWSLAFAADGDWSLTGTTHSSTYDRWLAGSRCFSPDGTTVTLQHKPYAESPTEQPVAHAFTLVSATDLGGQGVVAGPGVPLTWSFYTGQRPRLVSVEYREPGLGGLTADGCLSGPPGPWRAIASPTDRLVPRDSPVRLTFSAQMDPSTLVLPVATPSAGSWSATWEPGCRSVVLAHSAPFTASIPPFVRDAAGAIVPSAPAVLLSIPPAADAKGDSSNPMVVGLTPPDTVPPAFRVEYLANPMPDGAIPTTPYWRPLPGAAAVPLNAVLRVVANETLADGGVSVLSDAAAVPDIAEAAPYVAELRDSDGTVGSVALVRLAKPLVGGVLEGDPPTERIATYRVAVCVRDRAQHVPGGNASTASIRFDAEQTLPPILVRLSELPLPSGAATRPGGGPCGGMVLTFSEPVDMRTLFLEDLPEDSGVLSGAALVRGASDRELLLTYRPPGVSPPGEDILYRVRVSPGVRDGAGNAQMDPRLLNDPHGIRDAIELRFPFVPGDLNGDGAFGVADVMVAFRLFLGAQPTTPALARAAGATGGEVGAVELSRLLARLTSGRG